MGTISLSNLIENGNIRKIFEEIDENGNGFIDNEELKLIFENLNAGEFETLL